eukprot:Amastigsp_a347375_8.p2 type:complete len:113 gc:universal Amastigsp_a347375_8:515-177(-)
MCSAAERLVQPPAPRACAKPQGGTRAPRATRPLRRGRVSGPVVGLVCVLQAPCRGADPRGSQRDGQACSARVGLARMLAVRRRVVVTNGAHNSCRSHGGPRGESAASRERRL